MTLLCITKHTFVNREAHLYTAQLKLSVVGFPKANITEVVGSDILSHTFSLKRPSHRK
jgi:hypothetical protein